MKREELIEALGDFGYPLITPRKKKITENQIMKILEELASSNDPRLIEGFPVVLAHCAQRGLILNIQTFLSRHGTKSRKRRNLEKLFLISSHLLSQEELKKPEGLDTIAESLEAKYGDLLLAEVLTLEKGVSLSTERLRNALRRYTTDLVGSKSVRRIEKARQHRLFQLHLHLSTLFSPKQKELILKKLNGESFTKTEQEYYSRVVKKKFEALSNSEVRRIATTLMKK
jgi:hypothetical protein